MATNDKSPALRSRDWAAGEGRELNAVISVAPDDLLQDDAAVPVLVKDCIDARGMPTTYGSAIHADAPPAHGDAHVVSLLKVAGAAIVGKAALSEFCFGATGENVAFGNAQNPWDRKRVTGGSSSGSAASVAAGIVPMALGTDTGGSVRVPASLCGIVGLRPTLGRVSNHGCLEVSTVCDTIGPLATTVADAAWLYDAIRGFDARDPLSIEPGGSATERLGAGISGLRFGVARPFFCEDVAPGVLARFEEALGLIESLGGTLVDIALGDTAERREQHAVRFVAADVAQARRDILARHRDDVGAEFLRRLEIGAAVTGPEYAASIWALLRLKKALRSHFADGVDVILTPTCPVTAPLWSDSTDMVATTRLVGRFTYDLGAAGVPALSLPIGFDEDGLPVGMQLLASWGEDPLLFQAAAAIEAAGEGLRGRPAFHVETIGQKFE